MSDRNPRPHSFLPAVSRALKGPLKYMLAAVILLAAAAAVMTAVRMGSGSGRAAQADKTSAGMAEEEGEASAAGLYSAFSAAAAENAERAAAAVFEEKDITIGCTGAMIMHSPILDGAKQPDGSYDFSPIFRYITPYYSAPDFMTCELEAAVTEDPDAFSGHPMFRIPGSLVTAIADSGVDLQMLATNHIYDDHGEGLQTTMDFFDSHGLAYTGVRHQKEDPRWFLADIQGVKVGFFDYTLETEGDAAGTWINAIRIDDADVPLINSFLPEDPESFYHEARLITEELRQAGAQFIIADMHWGMEYMLEPFEYQKEMAQMLSDLGVGALIGGHPHCEEPVSVIESADGSNQMFCIYSVGNAMSNQMEEFMLMDMAGGYTEDGVIITLRLHQDTDGCVSLTGAEAIPTWMYRGQDKDGLWTYDFYILPLDNTADLEARTGLAGIRERAEASRERTMSVIGEGLAEAQQVFSAD